jgi:protein ImuB
MPLWLAIVLPALPLQLAARALDTDAPVAVVDGPPQRLQVAFCNDAARRAGIAPGHRLAAAQALAGDLIAVERKPARERDALLELAGWAYQFSGTVSLRDDGLLVETGGSQRLFDGRARLNREIAAQLAGLGYRAVFGEAATPQAAGWLARARARGLAAAAPLAPEQLPAALAPLPLALLGWPAETVDTLHALGLRTLHDLLQLPRDGVNRRFGTALLADVDRALGRLPDPQIAFEPAERFFAAIELPADVVDAAQLMFPAQRLLRSLEGFLRGRGAGAPELVFSARHSPRRTVARPPTAIVLALAAPERDAARLAQLLAERLDRVRLPEPAIVLSLAVERLLPFAAASDSFLPPAPNAQAGPDWLKLAETLHARLGSARVFQLQAADDHRPEHAWRAVPIAVDAAERLAPAHATEGRPLLIVPQPLPLPPPAHAEAADEPPRYGGALRLVAGPERIEAGWWDLASPAFGQPRGAVARDYFVARNPHGQTLWIYRDLAAPRGWFLHGFFA